MKEFVTKYANQFHRISNYVMALLAGATAVLVFSGCTTLATGALECSQSWINPAVTTAAVAFIAFLKEAVNMVRDGFAAILKQQPPIQ
jgi:hypothetical protein